MAFDIRLAESDAEIDACEAVIHRGFGRVMRLGVESPVDERRSLKTFCCRDTDTGQIVATSRLATVDYLERSEALVREYRVDKIPSSLRSRALLSFQSASAPDRRGGEAMGYLFRGLYEYGVDKGFLLTVSTCKPYLFPYFFGMGFRLFDHAFISADGGYRLPIVLIHHDYDHLRACGSPFASLLRKTPDEHDLLAAKQWFDDYRNANSQLNVRVISSSDQIDFDVKFLDKLNKETISSLFRFAVIISCQPGDVFIKENVPEQVIGFILNGTVDVLKGQKKVATLNAGEVFGEVSFLLKTPRTASLKASSDGVRIAFLSITALNSIKDQAQEVMFWRSLSGHLAERLRRTTELV